MHNRRAALQPYPGVSSLDAYDSIPYDRQSLAETHPDQLAVLARLFGVASPDPRTSRVLELGCAAGGNLIPMAWYMPQARFLGLDLAQAQVELGQALIQQLDLGNIEIRRADVAEVDLGEQGFDYIVAHGLYSWVPAPVRSALLALIRRHLSPQGVAYVSFNALPGWQMRGMLRQMLLFHVRAVSAPVQRLQAAREFLQFLEAGLNGLQALSADYLRRELATLQHAPDSYLYHEYLAAVNEPVLFSDFVDDAHQAGLRYLCNSELHFQFPATLGDAAERVLAGIGDPVARQQYLDFLLNRNFHQALLVRAEQHAYTGPDYEQFAGLALFADLEPPRKLDLRRAKPQLFTDPGGRQHRVSHPLSKAAVAYLGLVYPRAVDYAELEAIARRQVAGTGDPRLATQADHLFGELFQLFAYRAISASTQPGGGLADHGEPPCSSPLARLEAQSGRLVDSRHASLALDPETAGVLRALDGSLGRDALTGHLRASGTAQRSVDPNTLLRRLARYGALC